MIQQVVSNFSRGSEYNLMELESDPSVQNVLGNWIIVYIDISDSNVLKLYIVLYVIFPSVVVCCLSVKLK